MAEKQNMSVQSPDTGVNDAIRFTGDIQSSFRKMRTVTLAAVAAAALAIVGTVGLSLRFASENTGDRVYVLDEGSVLAAFRADNGAQRDLEAKNHLTRFHELFFNATPNTETINRNISSALALSDESPYRYFNDLKEQQFYSRLVKNNATQQVYVDSVKVDMGVYPYAARTYLSRYYIRQSNITKYAMETTCVLGEVPRSESNPHGLQIQRFAVLSDREIETRTRR